MHSLRQNILFAAICLLPTCAWATKPKLDPDTCTSLRLEQIKFRQSGILDDISKGAAWAKANLSADRLREIQHYLELDEQVQFGCRDAKLSDEAKRASEAAARIEINSDADPTLPAAKDPPKPGAASDKTDKQAAPKKTGKKKKKAAKTSDGNESKADAALPSVAVQSQPDTNSSAAPPSASTFAGASGSQGPPAPAMGFNGNGSEVLPWSSP